MSASGPSGPLVICSYRFPEGAVSGPGLYCLSNFFSGNKGQTNWVSNFRILSYTYRTWYIKHFFSFLHLAFKDILWVLIFFIFNTGCNCQ